MGIALSVLVMIGVCCNISPLLYLSIICKPIVGMVAFAIALGGIVTSIQSQYPWKAITACMFLMTAGLVDLISTYRIAPYLP